MPASRTNYLVIYEDESQVFGTATKRIALETEPPEGVPLEEKKVFFITYQPDTEELMVKRIPHEEVINAEITYKKPKKKKG